MKKRIVYKLLYKSGLGCDEYDTVQDARKSANLIIPTKSKPLAIIEENHCWNPPKQMIRVYFGNGLKTADIAAKKYCNITCRILAER
jgi:hypothetical protein